MDVTGHLARGIGRGIAVPDLCAGALLVMRVMPEAGWRNRLFEQQPL